MILLVLFISEPFLSFVCLFISWGGFFFLFLFLFLFFLFPFLYILILSWPAWFLWDWMGHVGCSYIHFLGSRLTWRELKHPSILILGILFKWRLRYNQVETKPVPMSIWGIQQHAASFRLLLGYCVQDALTGASVPLQSRQYSSWGMAPRYALCSPCNVWVWAQHLTRIPSAMSNPHLPQSQCRLSTRASSDFGSKLPCAIAVKYVLFALCHVQLMWWSQKLFFFIIERKHK